MAKTIEIDGNKLKRLLEETTGKTIKEISLESGFSDSFIRMACKTNKASASIQTVARLYGIEPSAYEIKSPDPTKKGQMSFDDIEEIKRSELLELIKDVMRQVIREELK